MDVVPMFDRPADPDAWHRVTAPGGYERWHFDAEDRTGRTRLVAVLGEGFAFVGGYRRRYDRYRRSPTRHRPPVAGEYPAVHVALYEDDRVSARFVARISPGDFAAATDRLDVRAGPNAVRRDDDGTLRLTLAGDGLSAELAFRPRSRRDASELLIPSRQLTGAEHVWRIADPLCDVTGTIAIAVAARGDDGSESPAAPPRVGPAGTTAGAGGGRRLGFVGRGYHDHRYGTAPLDHGLAWRFWGRVIAFGEEGACDDRAYVFHMARSRSPERPDEVHLIRADAAGRRELAAVGAADWGRSVSLAPAYPHTIDFSPHLRLSSPRVIDASGPAGSRLVYDAAIDGGSRRGVAFCELARPGRPRWPVLAGLLGTWTRRSG